MLFLPPSFGYDEMDVVILLRTLITGSWFLCDIKWGLQKKCQSLDLTRSKDCCRIFNFCKIHMVNQFHEYGKKGNTLAIDIAHCETIATTMQSIFYFREVFFRNFLVAR